MSSFHLSFLTLLFSLFSDCAVFCGDGDLLDLQTIENVCRQVESIELDHINQSLQSLSNININIDVDIDRAVAAGSMSSCSARAIHVPCLAPF